MRFHTETVLRRNELSPYYGEFIDWIGSEKPELLPKEKIERFKQLMTCPLPTIELTESITTALSRVFDAQDAFFRYDIEDETIEADWDEYRDEEFWRTMGVEAMMSAIDSVWVVSFGEEDERPAPENLLINIADVVDISIDKGGNCNHVIFSAGDVLFVYDDEYINGYAYNGAEVGELVSEYKHDLGYCPARPFWSDLIKKTNKINHKAPLTNVLGELDWLLTHLTFKKYMDIANSFPILVSYAIGGGSDDFRMEDNQGRTPSEERTMSDGFVGPGTAVQMPVPMEGQPDLMSNPVKWIAPEVETLRFHVEESQRIWDRIYASVVGIDGEQSNDKAKNEKQVMASFESQSNILRRIARNFEIIRAFADKTIIKLRYDEDVGPSIDYGSKFFLKTTSDLVQDMEDLKSSDIVYDALHTELVDIKFRNDTAGRTRAEVISDLDPLPGRTIEEAETILKAGGITKDEYIQKCKLMANVRRFEREQIRLDKFVASGDYNKKIELIKKEFKSYEGEFEQHDRDQGQGVPSVSYTDDEDQGEPGESIVSGEDNMGKGMEVR